MNPRPDFVMIGGQNDGQVYLLASKTLTEAELRVEEQRPNLFDRQRDPSYRHFVTAEMRDYVMVRADSYPEAFRTLFEEWTPEAPTQPQIGAQRSIQLGHQHAIDSGPR